MNLKKITLTVITLLFISSGFAQRKRDLMKEIKNYKKGLVSNAKFNNDYSEVWDAIYIIATEEYNTISRESEFIKKRCFKN